MRRVKRILLVIVVVSLCSVALFLASSHMHDVDGARTRARYQFVHSSKPRRDYIARRRGMQQLVVMTAEPRSRGRSEKISVVSRGKGGYSEKTLQLPDTADWDSENWLKLPDENVRDSEKNLKISVKPIRETQKNLKLPIKPIRHSEENVELPVKYIRHSEKNVNVTVKPVGVSHNTLKLPIEHVPESENKKPLDTSVGDSHNLGIPNEHMQESVRHHSLNNSSRTSLRPNARHRIDVDNLTRCLRPNHEEGVQDIFCVKKPTYLDKVKNPCWHDESSHVSCLPYFHILGCAKCSTTDLYSRLCIHPHIVKNRGIFGKEALWWSWTKYGIMGVSKCAIRSLTEYVNVFKSVANRIETALNHSESDYTHLITGDASPPDFWDFRGWPLLPQNHGLKEPKVLTPHLMKHLYREPKFILLLRNPTDRLYSDFFFMRAGKTPHDFHNAVQRSLAVLDRCRAKYSTRQCFYSADIYRRLSTRIHFGCYSVFLKEWLDVFPLRHFLFLKTEEYISNITSNLQTIYSFLKLDPLPREQLMTAEKRSPVRVNKEREKAGVMLEKTRRILDKFYKPFTEELATILNDTRFLWT
ncbi:carbohydrate sulfotransferase 15-like [Gigantopelta aegis]|uniref:carbohydrate sulfotransferase 15-like n=1 Tax=Gigantopelta aegis TaxID=1735272 RepID=UPI001B88BAA9|nr:carbohydrate sulfotransferase 15-like [Gigantopelta aegis]XP_041360481.1 carbohydrate sulfotransferase 15-like [Gigantopelta aegis]